jgi:hypothetical protein
MIKRSSDSATERLERTKRVKRDRLRKRIVITFRSFSGELVDDNEGSGPTPCLPLTSIFCCSRDIETTQFFQEEETIVGLRSTSVPLKSALHLLE